MSGRMKEVNEHLTLGRTLAAIALGLLSFGVAYGAAKTKLEGAVQRPMFEAHERAVLDSIGDLRGDMTAHEREESLLRQRIDSTILAISRRSEARDCEAQGYPSPWCDHLRPRSGAGGPAQAGRPQAGRPR